MSQVMLGRFGPQPAGVLPDILRVPPRAGRPVVRDEPRRAELATGAELSIPYAKLRFADFTGDGVTDVLAVQGGRWSISEGATGSWQTLNSKLSNDLDSVALADLDKDRREDVVRFEKSGATRRLRFAAGGRSNWTPLTTITGIALPTPTFQGQHPCCRSFPSLADLTGQGATTY